MQSTSLPDHIYTESLQAHASGGTSISRRNMPLDVLLAQGVRKGMRKDTAFRLALREARRVDDEPTLLDAVAAHRDQFYPPLTDREIGHAVNSAWNNYETQGRNWVGGAPRAVISTHEMRRIELACSGKDRPEDGLRLLTMLQHAHGWRYGNPFLLATKATAASLGWDERRFRPVSYSPEIGQ